MAKKAILSLFSAVALVLAIAGSTAAASPGTVHRSSPVDISSGNCHHETFTAGIVQEATDDFLRITWDTNGCGWWIWPRTHCENPRIGTDAGWSEGGHVQAVGIQTGTRPKCFDPNVASVNLARWHHSCNCGTTYQIGLAPGIKQGG